MRAFEGTRGKRRGKEAAQVFLESKYRTLFAAGLTDSC